LTKGQAVVRKRKKHAEIRLNIRLYPRDDADLIAWLDQFDGRPYGAKSQAIKEALRRGIGAVTDPGGPAMDWDRLEQAVEAAVFRVLAAHFVPRLSGVSPAAPADEDDETARLLDRLGASMTVSVDD
jgi:hypothetical protein